MKLYMKFNTSFANTNAAQKTKAYYLITTARILHAFFGRKPLKYLLMIKMLCVSYWDQISMINLLIEYDKLRIFLSGL